MEKVLSVVKCLAELKENTIMVEMYCVKCKKKVAVEDKTVKRELTSKGRPMLRSVCPNCKTKMTKFTK